MSWVQRVMLACQIVILLMVIIGVMWLFLVTVGKAAP